ncbi:Ff.00g116570.m01.CDS01 [Fusarium sp. VM40]|nr:Ff.00g116570.m01.CDS01 [Fusarium sp. VM40]
MSFSPRSPGAEEQQEKDDAIWEERIQQLVKLPDSRPRALTPDATCSQSPVALFQKSCAWFKVPPNIRRDILRLAFGDTRLHLQLVYGQPGGDSPDESQPQGWRWWSSRCHRLPHDDTPQRRTMTKGGLPGPWDDECHDDGAPIGVMGWLLSCRQNYSETIDILYSTNVLILNGQAMLIHLPQLIPPHRLESVTSLEVRWYLKTRFITWDDPHDTLDEDHLESIFRMLSSPYLPALRNLYMTLEDSSQARLSVDAIEDYQETILRHLDEFSQRMGHLEQFSCALPSVFFDFLYHEATEDIRGRSAIEYESYRQVWRGSDGQMTVVRLPCIDSYPGPPHHVSQDDTKRCGYWILEIPDTD